MEGRKNGGKQEKGMRQDGSDEGDYRRKSVYEESGERKVEELWNWKCKDKKRGGEKEKLSRKMWKTLEKKYTPMDEVKRDGINEEN